MADKYKENIVTPVDPATGVGKPFNFDAGAWLKTRSPGDVESMSPIESTDTFAQAQQRVKSLLAGEVPQEVLKQVEIRAAESAQQKGITGLAAKNLTFRDLGVSALDAINQGIQMAGAQEQVHLEREKTNRAMQLDRGRLIEETRQANDRFAAMMSEVDTRQASLALEAIKMQSANLQFRLSEENELIKFNTQRAIPELQQNMDSMGIAFDSFNSALQEFIELYSRG
jgi:hypothetical protein